MPLGGFPLGSKPLGGGPLGVPGPPGGVPDGYQLKIGPNPDCIQYLFYNSYRLHEQLNGRNSLSFTLVVKDGFIPERGQEVVLSLYEGGSLTRLFAGKIYQRKAGFLSPTLQVGFTIDVDCVDWNVLADQWTISEVYRGQKLGAIIRDIVAKTLAADGVDADGVPDGPLVADITFNAAKVSEALDALYDITGWYWDIDYFKVLTAGPQAFADAPAPLIVGANSILRDFQDTETLSQFRNSQIVTGGTGITTVRTERRPGDGETRTWVVEFPLAFKPAIDRDGVPFDPTTIGIRGVDEGKQFYWNKDQNEISQDAAYPAIPVGDTIGFTYQGLFPEIIKAIDPASIAERKSVEGGSGIYEDVANEGSLDGDDVVQQRALGLLRRYSLGSDADIETDRSGYAPGQKVPITVSQMGITARDYLITEMDTVGLVRTTRRYTIRATTGELRNTMTEFWKRLIKRNPINLNPGQVINDLYLIREQTTLADAATATLQNDVVDAWGTAVIGESEWG